MRHDTGNGTRKQYIDAVLWDQATGVARPWVRSNWPVLHGMPRGDVRYKTRVLERLKLENAEFKQEWDALREFLKT